MVGSRPRRFPNHTMPMHGTTLDEVLADGALPLAGDLRAAVADWMAYLTHERGAAGNTLEAYERDLRQFFLWLKGDLGHAPCIGDLARLDAKRFRTFMATRRRAGFGSRSLARTMSALRAFFRWLEAQEITKNRGVLQVALPKVATRDTQAADHSEGGRCRGQRSGRGPRLDRGAQHGRTSAALRFRIADFRGPRADAQGRAYRGPGCAAHHRQRRQGADGAHPAGHSAGDRALHLAVPLPAGARDGPFSSAPRAGS